MEVDYFVDLRSSINSALKEDIGSVDITAQLIPAETSAVAEVICRDNALEIINLCRPYITIAITLIYTSSGKT